MAVVESTDLIATQFVSDIVAAKLIGSTPATLRRWRYENRHLRFFKVGNACRYRVRDLEEFLSSRVIEPMARIDARGAA